MIGLYLWGVILVSTFTLIGLRNSPEPPNELGQDIAFSVFAGAIWPTTIIAVVIYVLRK